MVKIVSKDWLIDSPEKTLNNDSSNGNLNDVAEGGFITLIGMLVFVLANAIYQFVLIRMLGPAEVGVFNLGFAIADLVGLLTIFGLDWAVVRFIAHYVGINSRQSELGVTTGALRIFFFSSILVLFPFFFGLNTLVLNVFHKPYLGPVLLILTLGIPFSMLTRLWMGILQGYKQMTAIAIIEKIILPPVRIAAVVLMLSLLGHTSSAVAISYVGVAVFGSGLSTLFAGRYYAKQKNGIKPNSHYSEIILYSGPLLLAALLNRTNNYTETLFLGIFSSDVQIGIYTVCLKMAVITTIIFEAFNAAMAPFVAELFAKRDYKQLSFQFKAITRWVFSITLPFTLIMFLLAPQIMMLFGFEHSVGTLVLRILVITQFLYIAVGPSTLMLIMTKYNHLNLIDLVIVLVISVVLDITLIPYYGAIGAAIAGAVTVVFVNLLRLSQVYLVLHMQPYDKYYLKPILAGVLSIIVSIGLGNLLKEYSYLWQLTIISTGLLGIYFFTILVLGQNDADREILKTFSRRFIGSASVK